MNATQQVNTRIRAVKALRAAVQDGLDLEAFAAKIEKPAENIGRWLAGQNLPHLSVAERILAILSKP